MIGNRAERGREGGEKERERERERVDINRLERSN